MKTPTNPADPSITRELFLQWRSPRYGQTNPTRLDNKVWEWLIRRRLSAYQATQAMHGPEPKDNGPTWCFDRMGQTATQLPDGRTIYVAGEHEDYYDPDFYIYNDVVVVQPDGSIQIYAYPKSDFPPTDFHTATWVNDQIILIGSLGYPKERVPGETQVILLDTNTYEIRKIKPTGASPGWIHQHTATLTDDGAAILIQKGLLDRGENRGLIENIDDWKIHLNDFRWERLTKRNWTRWSVVRSDYQHNHLWEIRNALWYFETNWQEHYQKSNGKLTQELGHQPDLKSVNALYRPDVPHSPLPEVEDEYKVHRIRIDNTTVRYVEDWDCVQVTVEGELPSTVIENLKQDLLKKLALLENTPFHIETIQND